MAYLQIPISNAIIDQEFTVDLERTTYLFRFKWNFRAERWTMDIKTAADEEILMGVPVVTAWPLLKKFKDPRLPLGELFLLDTTGNNTEPGEESFGVTHFLLYRESTT